MRPIADFCCEVYHSLLTDEQDELLDSCQAHALRCIYGKGISYQKMREMAQVTTLRQRRIELCDSFSRKCLGNPRFAGWFPLRASVRASRNPEKFLEEPARCDRLKNSPVFFMRRRLNGKEGKVYGKRYCERRGQ